MDDEREALDLMLLDLCQSGETGPLEMTLTPDELAELMALIAKRDTAALAIR